MTTGDNASAIVAGACVATDTETGGVCGKEGNPKRVLSFSFPLCPEHQTEFYSYKQHLAAAVTHRLDRDGVLWGTSPGHTYVVRLKDGNVKIGKTTTILLSRLTNVSRDYNEGEPVEILAVLQGGESTELLAHGKFKHLRLTKQTGERFRPEPELMAWIAEKGIANSAGEQVKQYEEWRQTRLKQRENLAAIKQVARATFDQFDDDDWK
ncbi:GIY-YIG nuclease family protein [Streptomyces sp. S3(2020)]|uniref:GIY-YIG nuclease family protein n=1 Tax=Streptomyces sp. S3(2020) TaxID=2732044 RepID=UPI001489B3DE|nr:GIY-YIG nuclease family protein [Streptomyces sp. S3(2020)]NNN32524.1 GIY-YIG nuclease family protein [Streptomyces sp. S3(2020)]